MDKQTTCLQCNNSLTNEYTGQTFEDFCSLVCEMEYKGMQQVSEKCNCPKDNRCDKCAKLGVIFKWV